MKIAVIKQWDGLSRAAQQWPTSPPPAFDDIHFQFDSAEGADLVVFLNGPPQDMWIDCSPDRVWALIQEPPTPYHVKLHEGQPAFSRIYTTGPVRDAQHIPFFGALEWHVLRTYDELLAMPYPVKSGELSWVTSNATLLSGHKVRMEFLRRLQRAGLPLSLFGRGFAPVDDKMSAIAPYRYSIAFENYSNDLYWSEKLTDCFLGFSTPFYFGARRIDRYFPRGSYIPLDPDDPHVFRKMQDHIAGRTHEETRDALLEARDLCLNKYSTLFFIAAEAVKLRNVTAMPSKHLQVLRLPHAGSPATRWKSHVADSLDRLNRRLRRLFSLTHRRS